jgi:hypothetical protein
MEHNSVTIRIELDNAAWQNEDGTLSAQAIRQALMATADEIASLVGDGEGLSTDYPNYVVGFERSIRDENGNTSGRLALGYEGEVVES